MRYFLSVLLILAGIGGALAEKRVALVIGNDVYSTLPDLNNARKDATDMARKLGALGFEVILKVNAGRREMTRAKRAFEGKLSSSQVGLVFYAGHGIQADGVNYLIPSDARIEFEDDLEAEGIEARDFLAAMERAGAPINVVILDACRDNPLPRRTRSAVRGLAVVGIPQGAKGTAVLYSAGEGQTAQDGPPGGNGVFTGELLKVLDRPGLTLEQIFKRVAKGVADRTNGKQRPWTLTSLQGDFYFTEGVPTASTSAPPSGGDKEALFWRAIEHSTDAADYAAYLEQYPTGSFAALARVRAARYKLASLPPAPTFRITPADEEMVAARTANVRAGPTTGAEKVGRLTAGTKVDVTGRTTVAGAVWYRVALAGKRTGYVFGTLLREAAAVPPPQPAPVPPRVQPAVGVFPGRPGKTFRDCPDCPEMVVVPSGSFMMGSPSSESQREDDEGPRHRVTIPKPFAVGKHEVTFAQWGACVADSGCGGYRPKDRGWGRGDRPVIYVNWNDAVSYTKWLSRKTGKDYRLLTEAEWEYVARAGTTTPFHFGRRITNDQANFDGNKTYNGSSKGVYRKETVSVGSFPENTFGLHDMHGNVWEWVADCYKKDAYSSHRNYPLMLGTWHDSCDRAVRGGSWDSDPWNLRSAGRGRFRPDGPDSDLGFRVSRTFSP